MIDIAFEVHTDCEIPCIHVVMSKDGQVVSDHEAQLSDFANLIPVEKLTEYSAALGDGFLRIVDQIGAAGYNINTFNAKIQDMIAISKKKTEVDAILNPPLPESETINE